MSVHACPVCNSLQLLPFLQRQQVPVHQNLIFPMQEAALAATRGDLDFVVCQNCSFVFNRAFDLSLLAYGEDYDNTQTCSGYFDAYLNNLVRHLVENRGLRNCTVVEVGCGKGHFLRKLINYPGANNRGIGFDPSYVGPDSELDGRLTFRRCYYDDSCTDVKADAVVCRHVIEHVPEPLALLRTVRSALKNSPGASVFFETPCVEWIWNNGVIWDFFYEHCSLFTATSLATAFETTGFAVSGVTHVFDGQYLWLEAATKNSEIFNAAVKYSEIECKERMVLEKKIRSLHKNGKVAIWGAGAKGVTFANLIDPDKIWIDCIVDLNPQKQGHYIAGTGHPIISPSELGRRGIQSAILMNPNYRAENTDLLHSLNITLNLVDWNHS